MIELADVVNELRNELERARDRAPDHGLQFELGPIELEVTVGLTKEAGAGLKVRFWVIEIGGDGSIGSDSTQRIKLTLHPALQRHADDDASVYITGDEMPEER